MRRFALALTIACLGALPAWAQPEAKIAQGALSGVTEGTISEFKGIPFAAPPVGPLRWRAPQPAPGWSGTRDASTFGPICPQGRLPEAARDSKLHLPESEDCLTLNVWTPNGAPAAKLPVMVWIYGGSFINGGSAFPIYDGLELAQHGVVVVTLNYRLGWLGFFNHPGLAAESPNEPTGNFGLLDQIAALQWVKANIASFGGDPDNVTIFGESAGGLSVNDLMVSPLARGLFAKAISESGLGLTQITTAAEAQSAANDFATRAGAAGSPSESLAKMRALTVAQIHDDQEKTQAPRNPFVDGKVLPDQPESLAAHGKLAPVAYLAGSNSDEATLMTAMHVTTDELLKPLGDQLPVVRKIYETDGKLSDDQFARQLYDDAVFAAGAQGIAHFEAKLGHPAYVYQFAYVFGGLRLFVSGVGHGGELPFVFGFTGLAKDPDYASKIKFASDGDRKIAAMMETYWTNFARTGNPNGTDLPQWSTTSGAAPMTLVVNDETKTVPGFRKNQLAVIYIGWSDRTGLPPPN